MVVKGVVCKKNVAHRHMASKIQKPRFLILGGALEYQRVTNLLSSFDTLLQQVYFSLPLSFTFLLYLSFFLFSIFVVLLAVRERRKGMHCCIYLDILVYLFRKWIT